MLNKNKDNRSKIKSNYPSFNETEDWVKPTDNSNMNQMILPPDAFCAESDVTSNAKQMESNDQHTEISNDYTKNVPENDKEIDVKKLKQTDSDEIHQRVFPCLTLNGVAETHRVVFPSNLKMIKTSKIYVNVKDLFVIDVNNNQSK